MTTLLGDAICNIEEEDYQEACQHALKSPYKARTSDEEGGEAPSDEDEGNNNKSDSSSSNSGHGEDDSNSDSESNNSEDYDSQYSDND